MSHFIERNSLDLLERGGFDDIARHLFRVIRENNGHMPSSSELMGISPHIVILDDQFAENGDTPDILFFGSETSLSVRFPEADDDEGPNPKTVMDQRFRKFVSDGYRDALLGEPVFETIGTGALLGPKKPSVIYHRLAIRAKKKYGSYLITYSLVLDEKWLSPGEDRTGRRSCFRQRSDPRQLCSAGSPSVFHGHERR